jgi:hypothetical protein
MILRARRTAGNSGRSHPQWEPMRIMNRTFRQSSPAASLIALCSHRLRLLACVALLAPGGCAAGLDLAVIGAASQAAGTGSAVFSAGKLKAVGMVDVESARRAVLIAARETSLTVEEETSSRPGRYRIVLRDDLNTHVWVYLDQRTATLTRLQVNVGLFGSEPTARLLLTRIGLALGAHLADDEAESAFDDARQRGPDNLRE